MNQIQQTRPLRVPELGLPDTDIRLTVWLVPLRTSVTAGDRLVEIVAGDALIDLPAPCTGQLSEKSVGEDSLVQVGQVLGWITPAEDDHV